MWEGNIDWLPLACIPMGYWTHNPGLCPDWKSNRQCFASQDDTQPAEPHRSGLVSQKIFFQLYFIVYAITVVPVSPPLPSSTQPHYPTPSGNSYTMVHVHGSRIAVLCLHYYLHCTLHHQDYSVTADLYFLFPSPFFPISPTSLPIWQSTKHSLYLWFCFCSPCLFIYF